MRTERRVRAGTDLGAPGMILFGGKIYTADPVSPWAQAVAITGERVSSIGSTKEVIGLARSNTVMVDLAGRVVIPGINDAHDHLGGAQFGIAIPAGDSPPDPDLRSVVDVLRATAREHPRGTWLRAAVGMRVLSLGAAVRAALEEACPEHPVILKAWWGHGAILNPRALQMLGIRDDTVDPSGGWYERDREGHLTGTLQEYAVWRVMRRLNSEVSEDALVEHLRAYAARRVRYGVTTVQFMSNDLEPSVAISVFRRAMLPIRVRIVRFPMPDTGALAAGDWAVDDEQLAPRTTLSGTKWVLDGTPIEELAFRSTPYPQRPDWRGRLDFPEETIRAIVERAAQTHDQLILHVVGDATADLVLTQMETVAGVDVWRPRRVRLEHANGITGRHIERARRLGIVIGQPRPTAPWHTWTTSGIPLAYGSDGSPNPFETLLQATTSPGARSEAISREAAVTMLTRGPAFAEFRESEKGSLAPGLLADLTVLSQDVFSVPEASLPETKSVLTIVGGKVVFDALSREPPLGTSPPDE